MPILVILILLCICRNGFAEPAQPFSTRNQNPLLLIYGMPAATAAFLPAPGAWRTSWSANLTNTLNNETTQTETLTIDGEIYSLNFQADYGFASSWSAGIRLGWLEHRPGFMDRSIERYHDWLDLPQGDRHEQPRDQLSYRYANNNGEAFQLQDSAGGLSDIQFTAAHSFYNSPARDYSLHLLLKLPTGNAGRLTGSGATDCAAWFAGRETLTDTWQLYGGAGALLLGNGDVLSSLQENRVAFAQLGVQWQYWSQVALKAQAEWHSAFYKGTSMRFLGDVTQLSFGASWQLSPGLVFDIALTEDIQEEASPDVTFHFALRFEHE